MENRRLIESAYDLAEKSYVTGAFSEWYKETFDLPSTFQGKRVLDLCSGMSVFSEEVYQAGGQPIAVDFNYGDFGTLKDNFDSTFHSVMAQDPNPDIGRYNEAYITHLQLFAESLDKHPFLYMAASATHLPFKSDSMDLVLSRNGLFGTLDTDLPVLKAGVKEAIRVTKKGGIIQLAPTGHYRSLSPDERRNQRIVIAELQNNPRLKISLLKKPYQNEFINVIKIIKKK